ncbi:10354_t:CDS:2 [Funneliformis caledonium]|uniref:10354_t:CDS:1 n=1 Tax=Funneliformis caledonium TaxID=1117310 RepID=A0A9N9EJM1_9GLOM|nr:10354_t:CDS:2 [Funneliformis caledonium]
MDNEKNSLHFLISQTQTLKNFKINTESTNQTLKFVSMVGNIRKCLIQISKIVSCTVEYYLVQQFDIGLGTHLRGQEQNLLLIILLDRASDKNNHHSNDRRQRILPFHLSIARRFVVILQPL